MMQEFLYVVVGFGIGLFVSEWVLDPRRRTLFNSQLTSAFDNEGIRRSEFVTLEKKVMTDFADLNAKLMALNNRVER